MRLDAAIEEFVQYKRALGNLYIGSANILKAFLRQTGNLELNALTNLHCEAFLPQKGDTATNMWFQRYAVLDRFFRYAAGRGYMYHRVLPTTFPERPPQFVPYLLDRRHSAFAGSARFALSKKLPHVARYDAHLDSHALCNRTAAWRSVPSDACGCGL